VFRVAGHRAVRQVVIREALIVRYFAFLSRGRTIAD